MSVSGVNSATSSTSSSSASSLMGTDPQAVQDRFMTLLIEQLKNQDPLNPMDNSEMTSQMSQISMVSGIQQLNQSMTTLTQSLVGNQATQAVSLIGKGVAVPGTDLNLVTSGSTSQADGAFWLDSAADSATVTIQDANGNKVRTMQLTNLKAGMQNFTWDGLSDSGAVQAAGTYKISVNAVQGTQSVTAQPLQWGIVGSVQQDATSGWSVILNGGTNPISLSSVRSVVGS